MSWPRQPRHTLRLPHLHTPLLVMRTMAPAPTAVWVAAATMAVWMRTRKGRGVAMTAARRVGHCGVVCGPPCAQHGILGFGTLCPPSSPLALYEASSPGMSTNPPHPRLHRRLVNTCLLACLLWCGVTQCHDEACSRHAGRWRHDIRACRVHGRLVRCLHHLGHHGRWCHARQVSQCRRASQGMLQHCASV